MHNAQIHRHTPTHTHTPTHSLSFFCFHASSRENTLEDFGKYDTIDIDYDKKKYILCSQLLLSR